MSYNTEINDLLTTKTELGTAITAVLAELRQFDVN